MSCGRWGMVVLGCCCALVMSQGLPAEEPAEEAAAAPAAKAMAEKPAPDGEPEEKPGEEAGKEGAGPSGPVAVKRGPFKVDAMLEGAAESPGGVKISFAPREWADFTVVKVVPHGQRVKAGETLVAFDAHKLDAAIAELAAGRDLSRRAVEQAAEEVKLLAENSPLDLEITRRAAQEAKEDLEYFRKVGKATTEKSALMGEKLAAVELEGAQEELKQLEKMYKADDLTDATEEIILRRARHDVEFAQQRFDLAQIEHKELLDYALPRAERSLSEASQTKDFARRKLELTLPGELEQKRLNLAKAKFEFQQDDEKLARLKYDRQFMELKSPVAGVVYHGESERGRWNVTAADTALRAGAPAAPHETLLTVIPPGEMQVSAAVPARLWSKVKKGLAGVVVPTGRPETRLPAKLAEIGAAPNADGSFDARVELDEPLTPLLTPGLPCTVRFRLYAKPDALSIPLRALQTDELDDEKRFVYLVVDEDAHERRDVTVGHISGERVEILSGLQAGDEVLTEKPEDE